MVRSRPTPDAPPPQPLAERMRPRRLQDVVGQGHLLGPAGFLTRALRSGYLPSIILWGPPGSGKTTLAEALARELEVPFARMSAVLAGVKELRELIAAAERRRTDGARATLLFVDEIHRFNRAQQDALLPHVEQGTVTLVGATTENPSFEVNAALLSRCRVLRLQELDGGALEGLLDRATRSEEGREPPPVEATVTPAARQALIGAASGDARRLLLSLEIAAELARREDGSAPVDLEHVVQATGQKWVSYDKSGDQHYDVISAFIKSLRGSDPDAALHYLARMLEAGEEPRFIARRLIIFASEDVGNADPRALQVAVAALQALECIGLPEGALSLAQATTFLATSPKSNASYVALQRAQADVRARPDVAVPLHLRNAPTALLRSLGHGTEYQYPHDFPGHFVVQEYMPEALRGQRYYEPSDNGLEKTIAERLAGWRKLR